ncbi:ankyrin repeat-containing domain protein [Scenedesmus sp. NREL 46B-D3]|nr:ankyrin repeat-containing domain protein [Scenedesmus sp. NREL 46B-D3]
MGNCHSSGSKLLALVHCGQTSAAKEVLEQHPVAACYSTYVDKNSPLLVAAGRGHYRLVQAIVEAAVIAHGPAKAKQRCINHTNHKGHSALILACMHGHSQCVEALVCNGASPLVLDNSRHSTALHWAASACRSECVQQLLGSRATFQMQSGEVVRIADIPCFDEDGRTLVKYVDRHNGWGLTPLHIAVFKGSGSTGVGKAWPRTTRVQALICCG